MTTIVIATNGSNTFGQLTNRLTAGLLQANASLERIADAIATASSGYEGVPGTEFEASTGAGGSVIVGPNLFGVVPSVTPGEKGTEYSYAVGRLNELWTAFWAEAEPFVTQLDNGT